MKSYYLSLPELVQNILMILIKKLRNIRNNNHRKIKIFNMASIYIYTF